MRVLASLLLATIVTAAPGAQTPPGFEVASVKRTQGAVNVPPFVFIQAGRLRAPFTTLRGLVQAAYGLESPQVIGGPSWVDTDHFEVLANVPDGASASDVRAMLRRLLTDRFGLVVRTEQRELPVHFLDRQGNLGPQLAPAGSECKPLKGPSGIPAPPPPPPPPAGAGPMTTLNQPPGSRCGNILFSGFMSMRAVPMVSFVTYLSRLLERPIIDRTELTGLFDIDLSFLPDTGPMLINGTAINADAPSLQTAVREQLGLRLGTGRAPLDVVVIDRVAPPTDN